jgi:hypothetical protein
VAPGRRRAARAGRSAVAALQDGARRVVGALRGALSPRRPRARREPREEDRAVRARRSARRVDQLDPDRRRDQEAAGRVEDDRPVSRGQEKAIWERFRAACDRFFTRRHADLAERKTVWAENLAKKRRSARRPRRCATRPTGTRPPPRSSGCRPSGRRSAR